MTQEGRSQLLRLEIITGADEAHVTVRDNYGSGQPSTVTVPPGATVRLSSGIEQVGFDDVTRSSRGDLQPAA